MSLETLVQEITLTFLILLISTFLLIQHLYISSPRSEKYKFKSYQTLLTLGRGFEHEVESDPLGMLEALVRGHKQGLGLNRADVGSREELGLNGGSQGVFRVDGQGLSREVPQMLMDRFRESSRGSDRMLRSESRLMPKRPQGKSQEESEGNGGQTRRGGPIRIRIQRRGPAQSRSLKAVPAPIQSVAERKAVSQTKAVSNKWNWKPIRKTAGPKKEIDDKLLEAARNRLDSLTAPKVKIVHKKQREVVVMTKAPDPEIKDVRQANSKKISSDNEMKIQKTPQTNQSLAVKAPEKAKRRVISKKSRGRQPKKDWLKQAAKNQRNLPETVKMSSYRVRPSSGERRATPVNNQRLSAQSRTADIELPESKNMADSPGGNGDGDGGKQYDFDSSGFSNFDMDIPDGFADFGAGFDFAKIDSKSEEAVKKKTKPEATAKSSEEKIVPKREIPSYSAALKEHTYRLKGYKVPKKATKGSSLYVTDPWKNVELEKVVPDPRPYQDQPIPVPVKENNIYGFDGGFDNDFNSGFTGFTPDHAYQAYSVDEPHTFESLKPEPYKEDVYVPEPYTPKLYKPNLHKTSQYKASPHKFEAGPKYNYQPPNFRPPVHSKPYNKKSHEVIKVENFEPKPLSYHESSYQEPSSFHAPPSSSAFQESSNFQELNPFQSNSNFMAEPFLQSESFPESQPFFSRVHSTESYHQPEPIVHPVKTFNNPSAEFFGELSPRPRDAVVSAVPQRSRPAGPQPAFRSDPLESFPSFSGPSFDTFLLGDAGEGPGAEVNQPTFSSFNSPPSSLGQQRSREGSAR